MSYERRWTADSMSSLPRIVRTRFLASLNELEAQHLIGDWPFWAREEQCPPRNRDWTTWLFMGGRGAGKTRAGAEWVRHEIEEEGAGRVALVAGTLSDAREVMVEGPSGLLSLAWGQNRPEYSPSRHRLVWPSGAVASLYSAENPESLRGHQFDRAWSDEAGKWPKAEETWDMLQFALRLGTRPRQAVTTTPRPIPLLKRLIADPATALTKAATARNRANLSPVFLSQIAARFEGTRLGRQELEGELLVENPDALWQPALIERLRVKAAPALTRIVVGVDPPAREGSDMAACGIVVAGCGEGERRHAYVLADRTVRGLSPLAWARVVVATYHEFKADRVVVEVNQGGDLVAEVLRQVDPALSLASVYATRSKAVRAEPVAALYEQERVHHVGNLLHLELALTAFAPMTGALREGQDRVDALVWALSHLMLGGAAPHPRIRAL